MTIKKCDIYGIELGNATGGVGISLGYFSFCQVQLCMTCGEPILLFADKNNLLQKELVKAGFKVASAEVE